MRVPRKPGIYRDLPFETYLAIDAVSNTRLGQMAQSPLHYKENVGLDEKAKYLMLGQLVHAGRLEVTSLALRYAVLPEFHLDDDNRTANGTRSESKATKYVKDKVAEFERVNKDKVVVPRAWFEEMQAIVAALVANHEAYRMLSGPGDVELTIIWKDEDTGLKCKARLDRVCTDRNAVVDLKTTADLRSFPNAIARYGYHRQLAHYIEGWRVVNRADEHAVPWIVATEKEQPYACQTAQLSVSAVLEGFQERRRLLKQIVRCTETGHWPGPASPPCWELPSWATQSSTPTTIVIAGEEFDV